MRQAKSTEDAKAAFASCPILHVNGKHVVAWARHLHALYPPTSDTDPQIASLDLLRQYEEIDEVPEPLVDNALFALDAAEAELLTTAFYAERSGYTTTRHTAAANAQLQDDEHPVGSRATVRQSCGVQGQRRLLGCWLQHPSQRHLTASAPLSATNPTQPTHLGQLF